MIEPDEHAEVKLMGLRVITVDHRLLPEGILMFVKDGRTIGILDNRNRDEPPG